MECAICGLVGRVCCPQHYTPIIRSLSHAVELHIRGEISTAQFDAYKAVQGEGQKPYCVVRIDGCAGDTFAAQHAHWSTDDNQTIRAAIELAMPDHGAVVEYGWVRAADAGAARLMVPAKWSRAKPEIVAEVTFRCSRCGGDLARMDGEISDLCERCDDTTLPPRCTPID